MAKIGSAPSGENSSLAGTEKVPLTGSQWAYISTIASYIRTLVQTLTNKTINLASNTLTGTTAEFNTALSDNNFATQAGAETLTNKTIALGSNTVSGTIAQFNTAVSDADFATLAGSETLTNKTLTTPTIASFTNATHNHEAAAGGGTLDEDALALTDVTTNNSSTSKHGFLKKLDNDSSHFMDGTGAWSVPSVAASVATDAIWDAKGDLAVGTGANTAAKLSVGTNGHVLVADSAEVTGMKWSAAGAGSGDVVGPGSATDNAITRFDSTTGKLIQNSAATVDDNGTVNIPTGQTYNINGSAHTHSYMDYTGWISYSAVTPTRASADDPTFVLTFAGVDLTGTIGVGQRIKWTQNSTVRYAIVTVISFSTDTTMTVYGGTDYDVEDTGTHVISAFYYSPVKAPLGFPLDPTKWEAKVTDTSQRSQSTPTQNTWYNLGSVTISIPIGAWDVSYKVVTQFGDASSVIATISTTLSTANNTESDMEFTARMFFASGTGQAWPVYTVKPLVLAAKTSYYLNTRTTDTGIDTIYNRGDVATTILRAVCAYL